MWRDIRTNKRRDNHELCGSSVESLLKYSLLSGTTDNITSLVIAFRDLN
jgi:hypothetical protein